MALLLGVLVALGTALQDNAASEAEVDKPAVVEDGSPSAEPPPIATPLEPVPPKPMPGIRRLDRKTRAKVLSALAGFIILWVSVIVFTWLGARFARRYMQTASRPFAAGHSTVEDDDWARKKLVPESEDQA